MRVPNRKQWFPKWRLELWINDWQLHQCCFWCKFTELKNFWSTIFLRMSCRRCKKCRSFACLKIIICSNPDSHWPPLLKIISRSISTFASKTRTSKLSHSFCSWLSLTFLNCSCSWNLTAACIEKTGKRNLEISADHISVIRPQNLVWLTERLTCKVWNYLVFTRSLFMTIQVRHLHSRENHHGGQGTISAHIACAAYLNAQNPTSQPEIPTRQTLSLKSLYPGAIVLMQ